MSVRVVNILHF